MLQLDATLYVNPHVYLVQKRLNVLVESVKNIQKTAAVRARKSPLQDTDLNLIFLITHHLEEQKEGIGKKIKEIFIGKTPVGKSAIYCLSQMLNFLFR